MINKKDPNDTVATGLSRGYAPQYITDPITGEKVLKAKSMKDVEGKVGAPEVKEEQQRFTFANLNPQQRNDFKEVRKAYDKDSEKYTEFGEQLVSIEDMIDSDIGAAISAIKRQLARAVGKEVGVMTDADVAAFAGDGS